MLSQNKALFANCRPNEPLVVKKLPLVSLPVNLATIFLFAHLFYQISIANWRERQPPEIMSPTQGLRASSGGSILSKTTEEFCELRQAFRYRIHFVKML